jgi:hypothetical protein
MHLPRYSSGEHTVPYECSVCRFMSGAASAQQRDAALARVAEVDCTFGEGELGVEVGEASKPFADERFSRVCNVLCRDETSQRARRERSWSVTSGSGGEQAKKQLTGHVEISAGI